MRTENYVIVMFPETCFTIDYSPSEVSLNRKGLDPYYGGVRITEIEIITILVSLGPNELSEI